MARMALGSRKRVWFRGAVVTRSGIRVGFGNGDAMQAGSLRYSRLGSLRYMRRRSLEIDGENFDGLGGFGAGVADHVGAIGFWIKGFAEAEHSPPIGGAFDIGGEAAVFNER